MHFLKKGTTILGLIAIAALGQSMGDENTLSFHGSIQTSVNLTDCRMVLPMKWCYVFDHGAISPRSHNAGSYDFTSNIETGVLTYDDIWRNSYSFLGVYTREDGSEGVVTSINSAAADWVVGSKSWDDLFNPMGYGFTEDQIVTAIHNTYSTDEMLAMEGRNALADWEYGMMNVYVNNGVEDIPLISSFGDKARLVSFSTASDVGSIQASPSAAPGPAAAVPMIVGLVGMALRKRRKN